MKFTGIKKTLCFALAMAMLMAFAPMSALAADGDPQTITATADTYIRQANSNSGNALVNYSDGDLLCEKNGNDNLNNRYGAWPMVQFDLSKIVVPSGYEIDTAKINMYVKSAVVATSPVDCYEATVEPADYSAVTWSSYATQLGSTDGLMAQSPAYNDMVKLSTATLDGEITDGEAYEFDVTSAVKNENNAGMQTFVFYTTMQKGGIYFYSVETEAYAPTVTVTFKKAAAPDAPKTITATADTHIRGGYQETNYVGADMYCNRVGAASAVNKFCAWPMVQFDLSKIVAPTGYEIESAKIKLHVKSAVIADAQVECYEAPVEPTDYSTVTWSSYATQIGKTGSTMCMSPQSNGMTVIEEIKLDGEITDGEAYEFDVTDAVLMNDLTGNQSFIFYTHYDENSKIYFYSMETADYAPSMTVTYKEAVDPEPVIPSSTLNPIEMVLAVGSQAGKRYDATAHTYNIRNFGNDYKAATKMMFDLYEAIPADKVVTKAELKLNVKDTYTENLDNALRVVNYKDNEWTRANTSDKTEEASQIDWDGMAENARLARDLSISGVAALRDSEGAEIHDWLTVDVTEFVSQQINTEEMVVSFFVTPNIPENKEVVIYNAYSDLYAPQLVLTYEDASEQPALSVGTPTFTDPYTGVTHSTLTSGNFVYANVPVSGYSADGVEGKVILATYTADGSLLYIDEVNDFKFHAGNGTVSFGFTPQTSAAKAKVFVWDNNNGSISPAAGTINVVSAVSE